MASKNLFDLRRAGLLVAIGSELYKLNTEVKYDNLGSDPHWVRPTPTTFDAFVLGFPVSALTFIAVVLLAIGIIPQILGQFSFAAITIANACPLSAYNSGHLLFAAGMKKLPDS